MVECKDCLEIYAKFFRKLGELAEALPYAPVRARGHYEAVMGAVYDLHKMGCISTSTYEGVKKDLEEAWSRRLKKPVEIQAYGGYPFRGYPNIEAMVLEIVALCSKGKPT
jgi:hypothetical protein